MATKDEEVIVERDSGTWRPAPSEEMTATEKSQPDPRELYPKGAKLIVIVVALIMSMFLVSFQSLVVTETPCL